VRVLILRPGPDNAATAGAVAALGAVPVLAPLFEIVPVAWRASDPHSFDAVVMTSANAARHGGAALKHLSRLPLFAVGEATAAAAREAGFGDVRIGASNAAALGAQLGGRVLHLAGLDHKPIPTAAHVEMRVVYAARAIDNVDLPAADLALIHSPRAGARLAELARDRATLSIIAISDAAAESCGHGWAAMHIAEAPREAAMLASLAKLCKAEGTSQQGSAP
jgi:uroporphyrinogen-III synthase